MAISILLHIANQEPVLAEVDELPSPESNVILVNNPRKRDGKDVSYLLDGVTTVIWPWHQITFIEIMPSEDDDEIIGFYRE